MLQIADLNDRFPFEDSEFDSVIAMMVVEHLFDPFHAFGEIARIVEAVLSRYSPSAPNDIAGVLAIDAEARALAAEALEKVVA